jgi:hypothetical protein
MKKEKKKKKKKEEKKKKENLMTPHMHFIKALLIFLKIESHR